MRSAVAPGNAASLRTQETVGASPRLLLVSQLVFNLGFFAVIPFLAVTMRADFGMGALAIGIVLGVRTFAQQGMFLPGGMLSDWWGPRRSMVAGCLVRTTGYLQLVSAADFPTFLLGAVVTGIGGALFSPALESLVAKAQTEAKSAAETQGTEEKAERRNKPALFAWLVIVGEIGALVGPVIGALLLGTGFDTALFAGAGIFAVMAVVFLRFLPADRLKVPVTETTRGGTTARAADKVARGGLRQPHGTGRWQCLRDRRFLIFAAFYSVNLLAYNQLYFGVPVELERSGSGIGALAAIFVYASVLTVALQWPVAALMRRTGAAVALTLGFALQAAGFAMLAVLATRATPPDTALLPAALLVTTLALGHMCLTPVAMDLVSEFAGGRPSGAYYGLLASCGGAAVVLGNAALGPLYQLAYIPSSAAAAPWLVLAILAAIPAVAIRKYVPSPRPAADLQPATTT